MCVEAGVKFAELPLPGPQLASQTPGQEPQGGRLCIWHEGADATSLGVNGVNSTIWLMARQQARLGHDVTLLLRSVPSAAALSSAKAIGIRLVHLGGGSWHVNSGLLAAAIAASRPDVVHMHSVFIPRQASLARQLSRRGIPYITTPHGGLAPEVLGQDPVKKSLYARFFERPRCLSAAMLTASVGEEGDIRTFVGDDAVPIRTMPIGVDTETLGAATWHGNVSARRFVFLGRFDVHVKGIDVLLAVAGLMRDHEFHLYGIQDPATREQLRQIRCGCGSNVFFHPPVYGAEKVQVLCDATLYIQLSRCESFGISIAEAMHLGVPCAISEEIHIASAFREHDLGLLLPIESAASSMALTWALDAPEKLRRWSARAKEYARTHFDARGAAQRHLELYREVVEAAGAGRATTVAK
jgi:glycosyltransferase involved in cell wall biosynthesis